MQLATCLVSAEKLVEALEAVESASAMYGRLFPGDHPETARALHFKGTALGNLGRFADAVQSYEAALEMRRRIHGDTHPDVARTLSNLVTALMVLQQPERAEPLAREALAVYSASSDKASETAARANLARVLLMAPTEANVLEAESLLRQSLEVYATVFPDGHPAAWRRYSVMSMLGRSLIERAANEAASREERVAHLRQAEPLLFAAWNALRAYQRQPLPGSSDGDRREETLIALVRLYELLQSNDPDTDHSESIIEWQTQLAAYRATRTDHP